MLFQLFCFLGVAVATSLAGSFCYGDYPRGVVEVLRDPYYYGRPAGSVEVIKNERGPFFEEEIIKSPGYDGLYGGPWYSPYASEIDVKYPVPRKSINVKVDVPREPYPVFQRNVFPPRAVALSEKVKAPSVAVKERETLISGREHERAHKIISLPRNNVIKEIDLGCY